MATITVNENQLEEVVSKVVQQHLKLTFQDMDEVRKSPAGAIVRLETKIESLADDVGDLKVEIADSRAEAKEEVKKLRAEIANSRAETKAEFEKDRAETKAEFEKDRAETKAGFEKDRAETKAGFAETKAAFEKTHAKLTKLEEGQNNFNARLTKVEGLLKLIVALYFALFGIVASWFAKSVFFP